MTKYIVVGNKLDLNTKRTVDKEDILKMIESIDPNIKYYEASAKTGETVSQIFEDLARDCVRNFNYVRLQIKNDSDKFALNRVDCEPCIKGCCTVS